MSKAYPSNLTRAQYEFISDMIPEPKHGGRKREVDIWEVLNGIFYVLGEGVRWRANPCDFPVWQTGGGASPAPQYIPIFAIGAKMGHG